MDVSNYIEKLPKERAERFNSIHSLIVKLFPNAEQSMQYKMPTFSLGEHWVALANQKNYLSIYTCNAQHLTAFKKKHPEIKTGKGCINIKDNDQFEIEDLTSVITSALSESLK
jgi:uncharacterized protein YdhG (YjbR/CyaY superfamily)